jgi:hypothetical protein
MLLAKISGLPRGGSNRLGFGATYKMPPGDSLSLSLKIKATMKGLQSWSDRKVGNFIWQLDLAQEIVHQLEIARDGRQLSPLEIMLHNNLKSSLWPFPPY